MSKKIYGGLLKSLPTFWEREWQGLPEFLQNDKRPRRTLLMHFRNEEDVQLFAKLVGQKITPRTKFVWYPPMPKFSYAQLRYVEKEKKKKKNGA